MYKEINSEVAYLAERFEPVGDTYSTKSEINSKSDFTEIDFPKSRTVVYCSEKDTIEISVNYGKIEEQMKILACNNTTSF